jgi:hypothetical protein
MSAAERAAFEEQTCDRVAHDFRRSSPAGLLTIVALGAAGFVAADGDLGMPAAAGIAFIGLAVAALLLGAERFRASPVQVLTPLSAVTGTCAGYLPAGAGGFESPATALIFLLWVFAAVVAPLPWKQFLLNMVVQAAAFVCAIFVFADEPRSGVLFGGIAASGGVMLLVGVVLREQAEARVFLAQRRLDDANRSLEEKRDELASLNDDLEQRVGAQVAEIREQARSVDKLNKRLQEQVRERSAELAVALTRLARGHGRMETLSKGDVIAGRAEVVAAIGAGGMGQVYEAIDRTTDERVALKILHADLAADPDVLHRFFPRGVGERPALGTRICRAATVA